MAQSSPYRLVFCTCPDSESADALARRLVQRALAACVNIVPGIRSVYQWEGKVESASEYLLVIKTRQEAYRELQKSIENHHPYDVPEVISVTVDSGLPAYLAWIDATLRND